MAQRLVRKICKKCTVPYIPTEAELKALNIDANVEGAKFSKGKEASRSIACITIAMCSLADARLNRRMIIWMSCGRR